MRSGLGLCVLGLLCLHSSDSLQVYYEPSTVSLEHHINLLLLCDDPSVEAPVSSALHAYNGRLRSGHKLALFQILGASRILNRRRPAGWSPLRHILYERPYASPPPPTLPPPPPPPAPQSPSKASAKEESSEEDTTTEAPRPSASPDVSMTARYADAVGVHPLHCPSKPWKPFGAPVQPGAATEAPPEADSSQPTAGFRDTDMLA